MDATLPHWFFYIPNNFKHPNLSSETYIVSIWKWQVILKGDIRDIGVWLNSPRQHCIAVINRHGLWDAFWGHHLYSFPEIGVEEILRDCVMSHILSILLSYLTLYIAHHVHTQKSWLVILTWARLNLLKQLGASLKIDTETMLSSNKSLAFQTHHFKTACRRPVFCLKFSIFFAPGDLKEEIGHLWWQFFSRNHFSRFTPRCLDPHPSKHSVFRYALSTGVGKDTSTWITI